MNGGLNGFSPSHRRRLFGVDGSGSGGVGLAHQWAPEWTRVVRYRFIFARKLSRISHLLHLVAMSDSTSYIRGRRGPLAALPTKFFARLAQNGMTVTPLLGLIIAVLVLYLGKTKTWKSEGVCDALATMCFCLCSGLLRFLVFSLQASFIENTVWLVVLDKNTSTPPG